MQLNNYLEETFQYNDETNKKLLANIRLLDDAAEAIKLYSHLINCQYKWMARIVQNPEASIMSWWEPVYEFNDLEIEWSKSLTLWLAYIREKTEEELSTEITFVGFDNTIWAATPKDIALQLNYHSIHHRAQIQMILRQQGVTPDFVDYIGTKYRKLS
jgi:uncharacterized damage-inducible protein DinB